MSDAVEDSLRREIVRFCQLLHAKNYLAAYDGNLSARLSGDRVLVTPSGVLKAFLAPEELCVVDLAGRSLSGGRPTGELSMHLAAYRARPDVRAVVHAHPPTCIAISLFQQVSAADILPEVILSIGSFEVVPYARPLTDDLAEAAASRLAKADALILERHGTLSVGKDPLEAYARTERIEHAAQVLWLAHTIGPPRPLPPSEARALHEAYLRSRTPSA